MNSFKLKMKIPFTFIIALSFYGNSVAQKEKNSLFDVQSNNVDTTIPSYLIDKFSYCSFNVCVRDRNEKPTAR